MFIDLLITKEVGIFAVTVLFFTLILCFVYINRLKNEGCLVLGELSSLYEQYSKEKKAAEVLNKENQKRILELEESATTDSLTGLFNLRFFAECCRHEMLCATRSKDELIYILMDIDNLKIANDTLGHPEGDELLVKFANLLKRTLRECDVIGRIGGDEFALIMPSTTAEEAKIILQRLKIAMEEDKEFAKFANLGVSFSAGICVFDENNPDNDLFKIADKRMYDEKKRKKTVKT